MGSLMLSSDGNAGVTVLSNVFIDQYMKEANDAQVKVYLFLVRMLQANAAFGISDIADMFNHTEKDIMRALRYWEKCGVLSLSFGPDKSLLGIRLLELQPKTQPQTGTMIPDTVSPAGLPQEESASVTEVSHQTLAPVSPFDKPAYTLDELKSFQQKENTAQLIFVAEQYLGRTLSPADMKSILFFTDRLHFSDDLIDYLLQYCVERGKKDFRYIEKVAIGWAEANVTTPAEAESHASRYDKNVYSIMNALGKTNAPAKNEIAYIRRWTTEFGFETDVILEACGRTVLATDRHRFAYADSILASWHKAGVHHVSDIAALDSSYQKEKAVKPARSGSTAEYNRFMHSSYDFDALEEALLH